MTEIIEAIDAWTQDRYSNMAIKLFGFCELVSETSGDATQVYPMTMPDAAGERVQVSLDDQYDLMTWIRWTDVVSYQANEQWSFGKNEARFASIPIRIAVAHKIEFGEDLIFDFINAFPSKFNVPGFQLVFTEASPSIDPNHDIIYQTELGNTVYEKHRFPWNLYVLNVTMQFLECEELTP